jgi:iron complex outermembrane receptor protein
LLLHPAPRSLEAQRLSLGISGEMANGFDMDLNYTYSAEQNEGKQPDTSTSRFLNAIRGGAGSPGTWNLFDSTSNSQELIDYISTAQGTFVDVELHVLDFVMTGTVNDLEVATGFQMRKEHHDVARNDDSIAGFDANGNLAVPADLIFLGGGIETSASRSAYAIFAEAAKQASERVELRGAVRYEKLESDSSINPKVSIRMQANDNLVLRGSLSTSFREPSLSQLNQSSVGLQGVPRL